MPKNLDEQKNSGIIPSEFPKEVIEQAAAARKLRPSSYLSKRLDLRSKTVITFAEEGDKLSECAVSLYRMGGNTWQLGFHVPDVAEYVCEGSPLDLDARRRHAAVHNGFTEYDLFPDTITYDVCNLAVGRDRLALSVFLDIDSNGRLVSVNFDESVIHVAECCIYSEIDQLGLAEEVSSVISLREKYSPLMGILLDMYELAALFCADRRERGGLDCTVFRRIFENDKERRIVGFRYEHEPDSKAMVRELSYFAADAVGKFMADNKLPCIYIGQDTIDPSGLELLSRLVGLKDNSGDSFMRASKIADLAKGSPYYEFVCEALGRELPCSKFSDKPIFNSVVATDHLVSLTHPVTRYSALLTQRMLKASIAASGDPKNINLNKYRKIAKSAAIEATKVEDFLYSIRNEYFDVATREYIEYSGHNVFSGFPLTRHESGSLSILMVCGVNAVMPGEYADGFDFSVGASYNFEVIALGTDDEPMLVKPLVER